MTLVPTEQGSVVPPVGNSSRQFVQDEFRQRFAPEVRRNVMELSERPPMPVPSSVYQMADYPHIVIGGKPFFLNTLFQYQFDRTRSRSINDNWLFLIRGLCL